MNTVLRLQTLERPVSARDDGPDDNGSLCCSTQSWFDCGDCDPGATRARA